jgi:hypothetical protein
MNFTSVDRGLNRERFGAGVDLFVLFIVGLSLLSFVFGVAPSRSSEPGVAYV